MGGNAFTSFPAAGGVGGWVELARTTLGSPADIIDVTSFSDKRYYMILSDLQRSGLIGLRNRVGTTTIDTGSNYARRVSEDGGADATGVNLTFADITLFDNTTSDIFQVAYGANLSAKEKLVQAHTVGGLVVGATTAPNRAEGVFKWVNTAAPMQSWRAYHASTGSFDTGSEVVVLGWDPTDVHTTNFWEELASVDLSGGAADTISSGVFTSKKYLWVQCFLESSGTVQDGFRVGKTTVDTGTNYSYRNSTNGGADSTTTSANDIGDFSNIGANQFMNMFIVNNASNEKLIQYWIIAPGSTGAAATPTRLEVVGKWANTVDQIDVLEWRNVAGGGDYGTNTIIKVWGSD